MVLIIHDEPLVLYSNFEVVIFSPKAAGGALAYLSVGCVKSHLVVTEQIFIEHGCVPFWVLMI